MEISSPRMLHFGVTVHPMAERTIQQFREVLSIDHPYEFLIHDRDSIFSLRVDQIAQRCGLSVPKTPVRSPKANAFYEWLVGTIRCKCLDFVIPINERHLRTTVCEIATYFNRGRLHSALRLGIPEPPQATAPVSVHKHRLPVRFRLVLGGLQHEYDLQKEAA